MSNLPPPPPPPPGSGWQQPPPGAQPAYGQAPAGNYAPWEKRAMAGLIDWFGPNIVAVFVQWFISQSLGFLLGLVAFAWGMYNAYLNGSTGQSYGKKQAGIRLVRETDGQLIGGGLGIVRGIAHFVDAVICYVGFLFPLWDSKRQTIADKIMGTVVVLDDAGAPGAPGTSATGGAPYRGI